jgi:hypothetical protein
MKKIQPIWITGLVIIILISLIVFTIDFKTDCKKACEAKGLEGDCVSMSLDQTCESKFEMQSLNKNLCNQKQPDGFYRGCCCQ